MKNKIEETDFSYKTQLLLNVLRKGSEGNSFFDSEDCPNGEHILLSSLYIWDGHYYSYGCLNCGCYINNSSMREDAKVFIDNKNEKIYFYEDGEKKKIMTFEEFIAGNI